MQGGSSAPPPDPRLAKAQADSLDEQSAALQQIMANSADLAPLQKEQLQFGLDSAKTARDQSLEAYNWSQGRRGLLTGLQDTMVNRANAFNEGDRGNQLAAQAMEDVNGAYGNAQGITSRAMAARGINAGSGAALAAMNENGINQAKDAAHAAYLAREAARQEGYKLTYDAAAGLSGAPTTSMSATGAGAGYGASGVGIANAGLTGLNSGYGAAGGLAGSMGSNAAGMYNAEANYKNGQDQIAASSNPLNTILGAATGAFMTTGMAPSGGTGSKSNFGKWFGL
jgi:hypothetical protein